MIDIIKLTVALMVISMVAGLAIGVANSKTKDKIAAQAQEAQKSALEAVFPEKVTIAEKKGKGDLPAKYWTASNEKGFVGYAFEVSSRGYAGDIKYMVGVNPNGDILGMTVLEQSETPGLGSRVQEVASSKYIWNPMAKSEKVKPWFTEQFEGLSSLKPIQIEKSLGEWHKIDNSGREQLKQRNAVSAITGSTISTRAVTRGIEEKVSVYLNKLAKKSTVSAVSGASVSSKPVSQDHEQIADTNVIKGEN